MTCTSPAPSSPPCHHTTTKDERPRFFDSMVKKLCWSKADTVPGRHPDRWRKDAAGNIVFEHFCNCQGSLCFEYDHILPYSKGGESVIENCQILQRRRVNWFNRFNWFKSDKDDVDHTWLSDEVLDSIEMGVYGDVIRPEYQCRCRSIDEFLEKYKSKDQTAACKLP